MNLSRLGIATMCILLLLSRYHPPLYAHHSFSAEFDSDSEHQITGVVTEVWYSNPHVRYRLDVPNEDGTTAEWELQMSSVTSLRQRGWRRSSLQVGDRITARGARGRDQARKLFVRSIRSANGLPLYSQNRDSNDRDRVNADPTVDYGYGMLNENHPFDISGAWDNSYKFQVTVDDLQPKPTPFTPQGREVYEQNEHFDDPSLRCLSPGLPRIFGSPYSMEIVDAKTHYLIVHVEHNMPRRVYMDGREPPADWPLTSLGFSRGHWETNSVLVIETTRLLPGWLEPISKLPK